jgi:hypothetical protein
MLLSVVRKFVDDTEVGVKRNQGHLLLMSYFNLNCHLKRRTKALFFKQSSSEKSGSVQIQVYLHKIRYGAAPAGSFHQKNMCPQNFVKLN